VIDSSKAPSSAFVLRRVPTIDLEAIHLIRDSRGVAYSWAKRIVRPDTPGQVTLMHRYPAYRVGARWITRNALMEVLGRLAMTTGPTEQIQAPTEAHRSELPHWPSVSVVVPTHNRPQLLKSTVQSILGQRYPGRVECLVVFDQEEPKRPDVDVPENRELRLLV